MNTPNNTSSSISNEPLVPITKIEPSCLEKQLLAGYGAELSETDYPYYTYKDSDLNCVLPFLLEELKRAKFRFLSDEEFALKTRSIFNRQIDYKQSTSWLYVDGRDACNRKVVYNRNTDDMMEPLSYYVIKRDKYMTELYALPEVVEYQNLYPKMAALENKAADQIGDIKIYKWKNYPNLTKKRSNNVLKLVNRNLYLYNDRKEPINWLLINDEQFFEMLLKTYAYDKDEQVNNHFIKKIISSNSNKQNEGFFFGKSCENQLNIRTGFLETYLKKYGLTQNPKDVLPLRYLSSRIISTDEFKHYSLGERVKMVCFLANIFDPLFKKYHNEDKNWGTLTILADFKDSSESGWNEIKSEIIRNNYYGLSNIKAALEYADQFDGAGAPD